MHRHVRQREPEVSLQQRLLPRLPELCFQGGVGEPQTPPSHLRAPPSHLSPASLADGGGAAAAAAAAACAAAATAAAIAIGGSGAAASLHRLCTLRGTSSSKVLATRSRSPVEATRTSFNESEENGSEWSSHLKMAIAYAGSCTLGGVGPGGDRWR